MLKAVVVGISLIISSVSAYNWTAVEVVLQDAIKAKVMPGCVAGVATEDGTVFLKAFGSLTYGDAPPNDPTNMPVDIDTMYDLASLTKVTATTSAAALLYQMGLLDLDLPLASPSLLGPGYAANGKSTVTARNCLLHNVGYPPDPVPGYWEEKFDCPATSKDHPPEDFSCVDQIFESLLAQTLINPVGAKYVYSDLSMITMQFLIGGIVRDHNLVNATQLRCTGAAGEEGMQRTCHYEAFVRTHVFEANSMPSTGFLPPASDYSKIAPTWMDPDYRHEVVQGQVSDENSYALGGVAGHAGVFSSVPEMLKLMKRLMFAPENPTDNFLNATTVKTFTTVYNLTQSSRALGWDTNAAPNTYRGCDKLSPLTYTHTGYTGTELCNDPTRKLMTLLFTNRCYPNKTGNLDRIHPVRQAFNDAVLAAIDGVQ